MTNASSVFRQAAEAEGGMPISAGARVANVRLAVESGRVVVVDLSGVPEDSRSALIGEIKELVQKASAKLPGSEKRTTSQRAVEPS